MVRLLFILFYFLQRVNGDTLGYSQASVSIVVKEISGLLAKCGKKWIRFPRAPNLQDTKEQFYLIGEFPGVIGAIDCTHVPIKSPGGDNAEIYRNRKGWMSLNVQIVCGPKMQIFDSLEHSNIKITKLITKATNAQKKD